MRILFVAGEYPPMQGGLGAYTRALALALAAEGAQVAVLTGRAAADGALPAVAGPLRVLPAVERWDWSMPATVLCYAREFQADWLHVQYQTAAYRMHPAMNLAVEGWRRQGQRVAWSYHDLLVPYLFPKAGSRLRRWITERPGLQADLTIVTNEGDRRQLEGRPRRLAAIPIGSNIEAVTLDEADRRNRRRLLGYGDHQLLLGYFGFLNRSKGGATLIQTLQQLVQRGRDAHLLMIGDMVGASDPTNAAYLQEIQTLIRNLGLEQRVQWTGELPGPAVAATLNTLDALVMPYEDGVSLRRGTLMAGLANGCALVTTHPQSPVTELVGERDALLVPAGDAAATAAAVERIAADPALAAELRRHARLLAASFGWNAIARRHLELYADGG
jgi:glycosyltransferase involved in cell wall biosynthesis